MQKYWIFPDINPTANYFTRPKRKMSGPAISSTSLQGDNVILNMVSLNNFKLVHKNSELEAIPSTPFEDFDCNPAVEKDFIKSPTIQKYSSSNAEIDFREIFGFVIFLLSVVVILFLGVLVWVLFFQFVIRPVDFDEKMKMGCLWFLIAVGSFYFRFLIRERSDISLRNLADHAEIFISVSLVMVFASNSAFFLHDQSTHPLKDIGFMIIPKLSRDSFLNHASDAMTIALPIICAIQSLFMRRENRIVLICSWFRLVTVCYTLRAITIPLTALPGPAPHCRPGSLDYFPPENWIDVVTRVGPMHGKFNTCGDLLFSGHMCYTNSALLLYLRALDRNFKKYSATRWTIGLIYLFSVAFLALAGRKHYTVDIVLGIMISTLVFFHFEHGWRPACIKSLNEEPKALVFEESASLLPEKNSKVMLSSGEDNSVDCIC